MKQDGPEISCDAWELKGYCFLLKLLSSGIFFGTCTIYLSFFAPFFLVKKGSSQTYCNDKKNDIIMTFSLRKASKLAQLPGLLSRFVPVIASLFLL